MTGLHCQHLKADIDQFLKSTSEKMVDKQDLQEQMVDKTFFSWENGRYFRIRALHEVACCLDVTSAKKRSHPLNPLPLGVSGHDITSLPHFAKNSMSFFQNSLSISQKSWSLLRILSKIQLSEHDFPSRLVKK